ncbi:hypothetical protein DFH06DRAFT_1292062 [Mycena polygramma]|nr:hypothetical protein DFH06DRAFT_1292062 [Mycena polygramma]
MSDISPLNLDVVVIQDITKGLSKNPLLNPQLGVTTPGPSVRSSKSGQSINSTGTQSALAHRVLFKDQRCILTGLVSSELQACHLVNAIRTKKKQRQINLKQQVEFILTRQGFNGKHSFYLDSLVNCVGLDVHWHGQIDKRASFCLTVPLQQLDQIYATLLDTNIEWRNRVAAGDNSAPRNLDTVTSADPFIVTTLVPLILRPAFFLPDNQTLTINTAPMLRSPTGDMPPQTACSSFRTFEPSSSNPYLVDVDSHMSLESFTFTTNRSANDNLSVFSLLINAASKLNSLNPNSPVAKNPTLRRYWLTIEDIVQAIFYVPTNLELWGPFPDRIFVPPVPQVSPTSAQLPPAVSTPAENHDPSGIDVDTEEGGGRPDPVHDDVQENSPQLDCESKSESESESDSSVDTSEMDGYIRQASDSTLSKQARGQAAMKMLRMDRRHHEYEVVTPLMQDRIG